MSTILTKEDLKKLSLREVQSTDIPGLGTVKIKPCTLKVRHDARNVSLDDAGNVDTEKFTAYIIVHCLVEPKLDLGDLSWLSELPTGVGDNLIAAIYRISGLNLGESELKK